MVRDTKAEDFCKTISNFSLEFRAARQMILLQRERERSRVGAEGPGPSTPGARRKHQQTHTDVNEAQIDGKYRCLLIASVPLSCYLLVLPGE